MESWVESQVCKLSQHAYLVSESQGKVMVIYCSSILFFPEPRPGGTSDEKVQWCSSNIFGSEISQESIFLGVKIAVAPSPNFLVRIFWQSCSSSKSKFFGQNILANLNFHTFRFQMTLNLYIRSFRAKYFHK